MIMQQIADDDEKSKGKTGYRTQHDPLPPLEPQPSPRPLHSGRSALHLTPECKHRDIEPPAILVWLALEPLDIGSDKILAPNNAEPTVSSRTGEHPPLKVGREGISWGAAVVAGEAGFEVTAKAIEDGGFGIRGGRHLRSPMLEQLLNGLADPGDDTKRWEEGGGGGGCQEIVRQKTVARRYERDIRR